MDLYCHAQNPKLPTPKLTSVCEVCPSCNTKNYKGVIIRDTLKVQNLSFCLDPSYSSRPTFKTGSMGEYHINSCFVLGY